MKAIVAVDANWAIGCANRLLFRLPEDLRRFKATTMGGTLLMGRRTFESLPGPLPGREHIVLSASANFVPPAGVKLCRNLEALLALAGPLGNRAFLAGGARLYAALLPYCTEALVTQIATAAPQADAFFPHLDALPAWRLAEAAPWQESSNGLRYRFVRYVPTCNGA